MCLIEHEMEALEIQEIKVTQRSLNYIKCIRIITPGITMAI